MKTRSLSLSFLAAALFAGSGCTSPGAGGSGAAAVPFTAVESPYRYVAAGELREPSEIALAVVDADFSDPAGVVLRCTPASFRPDGTGSLRLSALGPTDRFTTVGDFCDSIRPRLPASGRVGLLMMVDGAPIGFNGLETGPDEQVFLAFFTQALEEAGVDYAIVISEKAELR